MTDFGVVTGFPLVSLSETVTCEVFTPSAVTVVGLATTVELAAEVDATAGAVPLPGSSPRSSPSPTDDVERRREEVGVAEPGNVRVGGEDADDARVGRHVTGPDHGGASERARVGEVVDGVRRVVEGTIFRLRHGGGSRRSPLHNRSMSSGGWPWCHPGRCTPRSRRRRRGCRSPVPVPEFATRLALLSVELAVPVIWID